MSSFGNKEHLKSFRRPRVRGELGMHIRLGSNMESPQAAVKAVLDSIEKVKKEKPNVEADNPALGALVTKLKYDKALIEKLETLKL